MTGIYITLEELAAEDSQRQNQHFTQRERRAMKRRNK